MDRGLEKFEWNGLPVEIRNKIMNYALSHLSHLYYQATKGDECVRVKDALTNVHIGDIEVDGKIRSFGIPWECNSKLYLDGVLFVGLNHGIMFIIQPEDGYTLDVRKASVAETPLQGILPWKPQYLLSPSKIKSNKGSVQKEIDLLKAYCAYFELVVAKKQNSLVLAESVQARLYFDLIVEKYPTCFDSTQIKNAFVDK